MADLEANKEGITVIVESMERPAIGRRKTLRENDHSAGKAKALRQDDDDDALNKMGNVLWKIHNTSVLARYALYILPVAALLAIPVAVFATVRSDANIGHFRLLGLFVWIEAIWCGLWLCKLCAQAMPFIFSAVAGMISSGLRKYTAVLTELEIPVSLFYWTIFSYVTANYILPDFPTAAAVQDGVDPTEDLWFIDLLKVWEAGIIVTTIFLAEKLFIQLVSINYHRTQYHHKIRESKRLIRILDHLYDASRALFPEFGHEFEAEDADIHGSALDEVTKTLSRTMGVRTKVFNNLGRLRTKVTAGFGAIATDVTGKQVMDTTSAHTIVVEALETERASTALARRLWLSFVTEDNTALYKQDLIEVLGPDRTGEAEDIFNALDRDGNGDVSLEEMQALIVHAGDDRRNRAKSMHDISQALAVLDQLLSAVVLASIAFVYATFFSKTFAEKTTQLWTTFTGLAFAIGGTVTEFLSCCIFLFVKHPYDVGDRVDISDVELVVEHISLMYSVFRRVDSDKKVQIPHNIASNLWIDNISRSKAMKERLTLSVSASTSNQDILTLQNELHKFVTSEENRRDFRPDIDIELISVGNLKQLDLQVEIQHKSNFANETIRSSRRNKFMCELLAAMRRIPIEPPGGSAPVLGDPANPTYSVALSDEEAIDARNKYADKAQSQRLIPVGHAPSLMPEAKSSAFQHPAQAFVAGITGRRNGSIVSQTGIRRSFESMGIVQAPSPVVQHGPVTHFPM